MTTVKIKDIENSFFATITITHSTNHTETLMLLKLEADLITTLNAALTYARNNAEREVTI